VTIFVIEYTRAMVVLLHRKLGLAIAMARGVPVHDMAVSGDERRNAGVLALIDELAHTSMQSLEACDQKPSCSGEPTGSGPAGALMPAGTTRRMTSAVTVTRRWGN
jgi:hypothetical protein